MNRNQVWIERYQELLPDYQKYCDKLKSLIQELIENEKIPFHVIESRTKSISSLQNKVDREGRSYSNPLEEVTDLVGIRVILYYLEDAQKVSDIVINEFKQDKGNSEDKKDLLHPNEFGYLSIHQVITLDSNRRKLNEWKKYKSFKAEIQIRTVLQHSWASISHILLYKKESDIPNTLKRKLNRLAGLLELTDEQFQQLKIEQVETALEIRESISNNEFQIDLNIHSVKDYLLSTDIKDKLSTIIKAYKNFGISNNMHTDFSQLVAASKFLGLENIQGLNSHLKTIMAAAPEFFKLFRKKYREESSPVSGGIGHFLSVLLYASSNLMGKDINKIYTLVGWDSDYIDDLIEVSSKIKTFTNKK